MSRLAPTSRERLGFRDGDRGTHSSRTLMLRELEILFGAAPPDAPRQQLRAMIVEDNLLGKRSSGNRLSSFKRLSELYALDSSVPVYRVMRKLWEMDQRGRPLLALLCAVARDPLLRSSSDIVLETAEGHPVSSASLAATVRRPVAATTRKSIGQNLASSWAQAGLLSGGVTRTRRRATPTDGATTYALVLGYMEGGRGSLLLTTHWVRLLDSSPDQVLEFVKAAARRGWVSYRAAGEVMDVQVDAWLTDEERRWSDGQ